MKLIKNIKLKWILLFIILPLCIIPVVVLAVISTNILYSYLENKNKEFYSTVLKQVSNNFDFIYKQYVMNFYDITLIPNFKKLINYPQCKTKIQERMLIREIGEGGTSTEGNTIRKAALIKFNGELIICEMDKKSLAEPDQFLRHHFSLKSCNLDTTKLIQDPLFIELKNNKSRKIIFGKPNSDVLQGEDTTNKSIFIYPYYEENSESFTKFILLIVDENFISSLYKDILSLGCGTLFILDRNNKILSQNHPSQEDFYNFDPKINNYIIEDNESYDPYYKITFKDYQNLITSKNVIENETVKYILNNIKKIVEEEDQKKIKIITYNNIKYLIIPQLSYDSEIKLIFFLPLSFIYKPIINIIKIILFSSILLILITIIIIILLSYKISFPIKKLLEGANIISRGNYNINIDTNKFFGEFLVLGNSFNDMAKKIYNYNEHLEQLVDIRTKELKEKNDELVKVNKKLVEINEENKRQLVMAQKIQQALIPKIFPETKLLKLSGIYLPMESLGGDLYDVYKINDNKYGILILDVCGHGVPAALITTMAKVSFSNYVKYDYPPDKVLSLINNDIHNLVGNVGNYLTAFYCIIDIEAKKISYTNAAHNEMYLLRKNNIIGLSANSTIVGIINDIEFKSDTINFNIGDKLILYTDGIPEARNFRNEFYGYDRLKDNILRFSHLNVKDMVNNIIEDLNNFKGNKSANDDIALLIASFTYNEQDKIKIDIGFITR